MSLPNNEKVKYFNWSRLLSYYPTPLTLEIEYEGRKEMVDAGYRIFVAVGEGG